MVAGESRHRDISSAAALLLSSHPSAQLQNFHAALQGIDGSISNQIIGSSLHQEGLKSVFGQVTTTALTIS
jgi:hypothetical protein